MIDFHSHFLPEMDDGAKNVYESLELLSESKKQGVDLIVATPHFYPDYDNLSGFLKRRERSAKKLYNALKNETTAYPEIRFGAEVLYFPKMSEYPEFLELRIQGSDCILIEPPMEPWTDEMLDDIEAFGKNFRCIPVIAHIDRYMRILGDTSLSDMVRNRKILVQANSSFFIHSDLRETALDYLNSARIHLIGSDCHNTDQRPQTLGIAKQCAYENGLAREFDRLSSNAAYLLKV